MGANVSVLDSGRQLKDAVLQDDFERAKDLVEKGAPVLVRPCGNIFLMIACEKKNKAIVDLLLKRGAEVNKTDFWGKTALMYAAQQGDEEIFDMLIKHNADVIMKDKGGWTVIHWAARFNSKSILDRLLLMGHQQCCSASGSSSPRGTSCVLTVDTIDKYGRTSLWWAAYHGHVDCVDVLLVHGANPDHKSKLDGSPLDIATGNGHTATVSMMTGALKSRSKSLVVGNDRVISELKEKICRYEEKIQTLEKEKDESDKDHWREIAGLREEILRLTEKPKSGRKQDVKTSYQEKVFQAVVTRGCNRWYALCLQLGYSSGEVDDITSGIPNHPDKIRAVFNKKIDAVGEGDAAAALLEACSQIPHPIIGSVMDILSN